MLTYAHDSVALIQQLTHYPMLSLGQECAIAVCCPDSEGKPLYPTWSERQPNPLVELRSKSFFAHTLARRPLPLEPIYENGMSINLTAMVLSGSQATPLPDSLIKEELHGGQLTHAAQRLI